MRIDFHSYSKHQRFRVNLYLGRHDAFPIHHSWVAACRAQGLDCCPTDLKKMRKFRKLVRKAQKKFPYHSPEGALLMVATKWYNKTY